MSAVSTAVVTRDALQKIQSLAKQVAKQDTVFEQAGVAKLNADKAFGIELYRFALKYFDEPKAVDAALANLGLKSKQGTSYFYKVARLAFFPTTEGMNDADVAEKRPQISKYATVIEGAHSKGYSAAQFEKKLQEGFAKTLSFFQRSLKGEPIPSATDRDPYALQGETLLATNFRQMAIDLDLSVYDVEPGQNVELLARVGSDGKPVLIGVLPKTQKAIDGDLITVTKRAQADSRKTGTIFQEASRLTKAIAGKDDDAVGRLDTSNGVSFVLSHDKAVVTISSSKNEDGFDNQKINLTAGEVIGIAEDLKGTFGADRFTLSREGQTITATLVGDGDIESLVESHKGKRSFPSFGAVKENAVVFEVSNPKSAPNEIQDDVLGGVEFQISHEQIGELLGFKAKRGAKAFTLVVSEKAVGFEGEVSVPVDASGAFKVVLTKENLNAVRKAVKQLRGFNKEHLAVVGTDSGVLLKTEKKEFEYSVFVPASA